MSEQTLRITGMSCAACQHHVESALAAVPGVRSVSVNLMAHTGSIVAENAIPSETLIGAVRGAGYGAYVPGVQSSVEVQEAESSNLGTRTILAFCAGALAMALSMPLMMSSREAGSVDPLLRITSKVFAPLMPSALMSLPAGAIRYFLAALSVAVMVFAAPEIYVSAWRAQKHRTSNMNTLVARGTLAAFLASLGATLSPEAFARHGLATDVYFEATILILAFLLAGRWLETRARNRATSALQGFAKLEASQARLLSPSPGATDFSSLPETLLPLDALEPGDVFRLLPGDRIPLDGLVLQGRSSVDESMLTGEPLPITRSADDRLYAGTLNLDGALVVRATATGAQSTLAQMQRLLAQAQSNRASMQRLADRVSAVFVPNVQRFALLTFAVWYIAGNTRGHHDGFGHALSATIAVLIIACPCAMGLAVPAAVTVSVGSAARAGLLIKGGEVLERLAQVDVMALDKTGTLTEGRPHIETMQLATTATLDAGTLLAYVAAAERLSTHPLAGALVRFCEVQGVQAPAEPIHDLTVLPGLGLTATIAGHTLLVGNGTLLPDAPRDSSLAAPVDLQHATPVFVLLDGVPQAVFFATDQLRASAVAAVAELRALGLRPVLLTGDTAESAAPIAHSVGITDVRAGLLPADKLAVIQELQAQRHRVAMAGDGINDAAALAQSDTGVAMASGTDLAREAGDVLLLHHNLLLLPLAVRVARRTVRVMRQNLGWALVYNVVGLPIAAGVLYPHFHVLLSPVLASAAMALSSVSVLANSLRLRRLPREAHTLTVATHGTLRPAALHRKIPA